MFKLHGSITSLMVNQFMRNKLPLYGLNTNCARYFSSSSILNSIFRGTVNNPESGATVDINRGGPVNHLVINKILFLNSQKNSFVLIINLLNKIQ